MSKKVFFNAANDTCEPSNYNGSLILKFFVENDFILVNKPSEADMIIINACCVDEFREMKSLKTIKFFLKKYGKEKAIIVSGCLIRKIQNVVSIGPKKLYKFNKLIDARIPIEKVRINNIIVGDRGYGRDVFHLLLSRGCLSKCNYCAIKKVKGSVTSKPLNEVLKEFREGLKRGYKKFALLGDELGCYGTDIGTDIMILLEKMCEEKGNFRLMLTNFEPSWFLKFHSRLSDIFKLGKIDSINLPIQSTSNRLVKLMGRDYDADKIIDIVKKIKLRYNIKFYTDIIFGFPTETKEEFLDSFKVINMFDTVNFNVFSERPGTPACKIKPKIHRKEVKERLRMIKRLKMLNPDKEIVHSLEDV